MAEIILRDIMTAGKQCFLYAITTSVIGMAVIYCIISWFSKYNIKEILQSYKIKLALIYILYVYCFGMLSITLLSREPGSRDGLDLRLFSTISRNFSDNIYPVENVILFIPLGMLLPALLKAFKKIHYCMLLGFFFSLAIELSQYLTKRGYFQIDDILTNTIGCMIGLGFFTIVYRLKSWVYNCRIKALK